MKPKRPVTSPRRGVPSPTPTSASQPSNNWGTFREEWERQSKAFGEHLAAMDAGDFRDPDGYGHLHQGEQEYPADGPEWTEAEVEGMLEQDVRALKTLLRGLDDNDTKDQA